MTSASRPRIDFARLSIQHVTVSTCSCHRASGARSECAIYPTTGNRRSCVWARNLFALISQSLAVSRTIPELAQLHDTAYYIRPCDCASPLIRVFHHSKFFVHELRDASRHGAWTTLGAACTTPPPPPATAGTVCANIVPSFSFSITWTLCSHRPACGGIGQLDTSGMGFFYDLDSSPIPFLFLLNTKSAFTLSAPSRLQCAIISLPFFFQSGASISISISTSIAKYARPLLSVASLSSPSFGSPRFTLFPGR
jgi:hypothetical protein